MRNPPERCLLGNLRLSDLRVDPIDKSTGELMPLYITMFSLPYVNATKPHDGLSPAWAQQFQSSGALTIVITITAFLFFKVKLGGIFAAWPFFSRRYDFIKSNFEKTGRRMFSFNVLHHSVTVVKGVNARRAFYNDKNLNFMEGYLILMGGAPRLSDIQIHNDGDDSPLMVKRMAILLRKDRLSDVIPTLLENIQGRMEAWGKQGTMDPFQNIYDVVFQMTVRVASCRELASDLHALAKFQKYYWTVEKSATPTALLFPWFPGPAKHAKAASTKALFTTLWNYIEKRKTAKAPNSDAIDVLLGQEMSNEDIIQCVLGIIFGGVVNTGISACWILLYISFHAKWKSAIHAEIHALLTQYTNSSEPLHKRLSAIPISVWEDEMPTLDIALRETIRIVVNFTALRRNLPGAGGVNLKIPGGDGQVPSGGFLAYSMTDAHLNPKIYTDPAVFDPERYGPGREEDKREPYAYVGWGAGRHPCAGIKLAKLEIKMIVAMFVVGYEYDTVDAKGRFMERLPVPDYNDNTHQARPVGETCFIKFKRVVE